MNEDLTHIINTLEVIARESKNSDEILEALSLIVELLNNCDKTRNKKSYLKRIFNIDRLKIEVTYDGAL